MKIRACIMSIALASGVAACSDHDASLAAPRSITSNPGPTTTDAPITTTTAAPLLERSFATTMDSPADLPGYHVFRPADVEVTGATLPVIVWANGGCVRYDVVWQPLLQRWAAAGFVVISIAAPPEGDPAQAGATTAADQAIAIDWAVAQNGAPGGPLQHRLDLDRLVAAGNSCGGITSIALAGSDPRVRSVFVLSGSGSLPGATREAASEVMSKISVPVAYVVGGPEDLASAATQLEYDVLAADVPVFRAARFEGDHRTVSTSEPILAEVAEISLNWFDLALYGHATVVPTLTSNPCPSCEPTRWTTQAKHLEALTTS